MAGHNSRLDLSGTTLRQRYHLQARIGAGGFATVYRAHDAHLGKLVAVKVLHPEHTKEIQDLERFRNEAAIAARIDDDFLVRVSDYGQDGTYFFFVMEHLVGQSLREELRKLEGRPMSWTRAFKVADQVCSALEVAHAHDIIHRDVKPENIFITRRRNAEAIKLLDLGVAKILQDQYWSGLQKNLSRTNQLIGSPCYISPEQIQGARNCDARIDIYSLGVVLYELVTGIVPFRGNTVWETMYQHVNARPIAPTVRVPGISLPGPLEAIILRAMEKDPKDRFRTIREMGMSIRFELSHLRSDRALARSAQLLPALTALEAPDRNVSLPAVRAAANPDSGPAAGPTSSPPRSQPVVELRGELLPKRTAGPDVPSPPDTAAGQSPPRTVDVEAAVKPPGGELLVASSSPSCEEAELTREFQPRGGVQHPPPLPLSGTTKIMLGFLVAASLTVTCSVSTVLAMTLDTSWVDRRLRAPLSTDTEITEEEEEGSAPPAPQIVAGPRDAAETSPPEIRDDHDTVPDLDAPPSAAVPTTEESPKRTVPSSSRRGVTPGGRAPKAPDPADDLLPVERTMRSIARRAASQIKRTCRISFLSNLEHADYQIVFHVDVQTGVINRVEPSGQLLPFEKERCVENLAKSVIGSFQGASDLQAKLVHSYSVSKQG